MKKVYHDFVNMCFLFLSKRFASVYSSNCYQSIDTLPIFYWNKIQESGNLAWLIRSENIHIEKKKVGRIRAVTLGILWRKLLDEFIERFGFSDSSLEIIRKQKEIITLTVDKITNDNKSANAFIKIAEEQLKALQANDKGINFHELKAVIELEWGHLNPMIVTVGEFYSYVKILQNRAKKQTASHV